MNSSVELHKLKKILVMTLFSSLGLITFFSLFLYIDSGLFNADFCFSTSCFKRFFSIFHGVPTLVDFLIKIFIGLATVLGVIYALDNYLNSASTSRTNVYLSHLKIFNDYVLNEFKNDTRISIKGIDTLKWYNLAFPHSRDGSLVVGKDYKDFIAEIRRVIEISNSKITGKIAIAFDYKNHQSQMIPNFKKIGVNIQRLPKNDFFEVESVVFSIINKVNKELCMDDSISRLIETKFK